MQKHQRSDRPQRDRFLANARGGHSGRQYDRQHEINAELLSCSL